MTTTVVLWIFAGGFVCCSERCIFGCAVTEFTAPRLSGNLQTTHTHTHTIAKQTQSKHNLQHLFVKLLLQTVTRFAAPPSNQLPAQVHKHTFYKLLPTASNSQLETARTTSACSPRHVQDRIASSHNFPLPLTSDMAVTTHRQQQSADNRAEHISSLSKGLARSYGQFA